MQSENRSCESVRRLLDSYVSNELLVETNLDIVDHLEACVDCSTAVNNRVQARAALKQAAHTETAPSELLEGIRRALPRRRETVREAWGIAAVVLLGLLVGGAGIWYLRPHQKSAAADIQRVLSAGLAVREHCPSEAGFDSLGWEYDGLVEAIGEEKPSNYGITAAHRCIFDGRLFINAILQEGDARVAFVVTEKESEQFSNGDRARAFEASGIPIYSSTIDNHQISGFETGRYLAYVISDLSADANLRLASSIAALYAPSMRSTQKEARNGH